MRVLPVLGRRIQRAVEELLESFEGVERPAQIAIRLSDVEPDLGGSIRGVGSVELLQRTRVVSFLIQAGPLAEQTGCFGLVLPRWGWRGGLREQGEQNDGCGGHGHRSLMSRRLLSSCGR